MWELVQYILELKEARLKNIFFNMLALYKHVCGVIEFSDLEGMFEAGSVFKGLREDCSQLTFCITHLTFELCQIVFILLQER